MTRANMVTWHRTGNGLMESMADLDSLQEEQNRLKDESHVAAAEGYWKPAAP